DQTITAALAGFLDTYLLGHDRAAMLTVQLSAGAAEQAARRDQHAAALRKRLTQTTTAQKGLVAQSERLGDDTSPAANPMRHRLPPGIIAALLADPRTDSDTAAGTPAPTPFEDMRTAAMTPETADKSPCCLGRRAGWGAAPGPGTCSGRSSPTTTPAGTSGT